MADLRVLRWEVSFQPHASTMRMNDVTKHCHSIPLATTDCRDNSNERAVITGMIAVASLLIALEISFGSPSARCGDHLLVICLESLIHANYASRPVDSWSHWPHLRRHKLGAILGLKSVSERSLGHTLLRCEAWSEQTCT